MHKVVLSICEKVHLLLFSVFVGYIFKGAGGASVQWIGSLKNKKKRFQWKYVRLVITLF